MWQTDSHATQNTQRTGQERAAVVQLGKEHQLSTASTRQLDTRTLRRRMRPRQYRASTLLLLARRSCLRASRPSRGGTINMFFYRKKGYSHHSPMDNQTAAECTQSNLANQNNLAVDMGEVGGTPHGPCKQDRRRAGPPTQTRHDGTGRTCRSARRAPAASCPGAPPPAAAAAGMLPVRTSVLAPVEMSLDDGV